MSAVAKANGFLAEIQAGAEALYHRTAEMAAELAAEAEKAAPVVATVVSDLEPVLAAVGVPAEMVAGLARGIRAIAAAPAVEQLAADASSSTTGYPAPIPATPSPAPIPA